MYIEICKLCKDELNEIKPINRVTDFYTNKERIMCSTHGEITDTLKLAFYKEPVPV